MKALPKGKCMDITVGDKKLRKAIESEFECRRRFGAEMARKIALRLVALRAAASLAVFWPPMSGPERCHELKGDLAGTFSMDLKQPYRLLFREVERTDERSKLIDEHERWKSITAVEILGVKDTHG
jgi:proteic killer suppression protein